MSDEAPTMTRIRINLSSGELELEGREEFVSQYADSIEELLIRLREDGPSSPSASTALATQMPDAGQATRATSSNPEPFGEMLHSLSSKTGTDQILLAGYYVSAANSDGTFSTVEAHKLLMEQGIKLSNASQSLKNNLTSKRVFKVGSRYKVAKSGMDYLRSAGVAA